MDETVNGAPRCPVAHGKQFDPMNPEQVLDPQPWLSIAREECPVFYMSEYDEWIVTRYEDVLKVVKDTKAYTSKHLLKPRVLPGLEDVFPNGHPLAGALVNTDPPAHTRLRKLAQKAFTPKAIAAHEDEVRACANALIDEFIADGRVDITLQYTRPLAGGAIAIATGADAAKAKDFVHFSDDVLRSVADSSPLAPEEQAAVAEGVRSFFEWLDALIEDRRQEPREDLCSLLVHAKSDDGSPSLTNWEVVRILTNLLSAGIDTTSSALTFGLYELLRKRERWERLQRDPELIPTVVEEIVRFSNPVRGLRRDTLEEVELSGVRLPEGSTISLNYASAQRDESVFENPEEFKVDREDVSKHFGFGKGAHFCIGAPLARLEVAVTLELLLERIPEVRLPEGEVPQVMPSRLAAVALGMNLEW